MMKVNFKTKNENSTFYLGNKTINV
jgi:hypothetical protein